METGVILVDLSAELLYTSFELGSQTEAEGGGEEVVFVEMKQSCMLLVVSVGAGK